MQEPGGSMGNGQRHGTVKEQSRYRRVRFTGLQYASVKDGTTVVNAQVEPLGSTAVGVSTARAVLSEIS